MGSADLLLHPVRLRIIQSFLGRATLTTTQLRGLLPGVPAATVYRQVATLLEAEVLEIVSEQKVRGAVERTMRLRPSRLSVEGDEAAAMDVDEHRRAFLTFVASLLADFDHYLDAGDVDLARDLVGYRQRVLVADDDEMREFLRTLADVAQPLADRAETGGRRRRLFTTALILAAPLPGDAPDQADAPE